MSVTTARCVCMEGNVHLVLFRADLVNGPYRSGFKSCVDLMLYLHKMKTEVSRSDIDVSIPVRN